ncbi:MAG: class IV adenylate cyclase [Planctomycetia bacterium]
MTLEVELKFRVDDPTAFLSKPPLVAAKPLPVERHADRYFNHPSRDFAATDEAVRLRRVGASNRITYKGPKLDVATKTRREIEIDYAAGPEAQEQFAELLAALGFREVLTVEKTRAPFELTVSGRAVTACVDVVDDVGTFVELETLAEPSELESARRLLLEFAAELGLHDGERRSYLELLIERRARTKQ